MNETAVMLNKLLDVTSERQRVLANNLANVDTPGYVRQDVRFHKILSEAVESGRMERIKEARPEVYYDTATPSRPDGNNVSTQKELGEMMQNELLYQFSSKALSSVYGGLLKAIKGK